MVWYAIKGGEVPINSDKQAEVQGFVAPTAKHEYTKQCA